MNCRLPPHIKCQSLLPEACFGASRVRIRRHLWQSDGIIVFRLWQLRDTEVMTFGNLNEKT